MFSRFRIRWVYNVSTKDDFFSTGFVSHHVVDCFSLLVAIIAAYSKSVLAMAYNQQ